MERLYSQGDRQDEVKLLSTREAWVAAMLQFPVEVRHHAANLAAHDWDVTMIGDRLLVSCPWSGGHWFEKDGTRITLTLEEEDRFYPRVPYVAADAGPWRRAVYTSDKDELGRQIKRQRALNLSEFG